MNEVLLNYVWKFRCLKAGALYTTSGDPLTILKPGKENKDAGPDFFMSEIIIGGTRWVGNVEVHVKSSDWELHRHQNDRSYNNVILHVVYIHDRDILVEGRRLPTLELKHHIDQGFIERFDSISKNHNSIPCENLLPNVEDFHINSWLNRLLLERLTQRNRQLQLIHQNTSQDLLETFYRWLMIGFGQKVNKEAFLQLAIAVPLKLARKYLKDPGQLEALYFGMSALVPEDCFDEYADQLRENFAFLRHKHKLSPMNPATWKFLRMRPNGFPSIRLAQFVSLISRIDSLESLLMNEDSGLKEIWFDGVHPYWSNHYSFGNESTPHEVHPGKDFLNHIQLNVFVPFRVFRLKLVGEEAGELIESFFDKLPPEHNQITRKMAAAGFNNGCGVRSQALIQLHNLYCEEKKCLLCNIGYQVLKP